MALLAGTVLGVVATSAVGHHFAEQNRETRSAQVSAPASSHGPAPKAPPAPVDEYAGLPEIARELRQAVDRNRQIHAARARAMTSEQRLEHIRKRMAETDMPGWVWLQVNVADLRLELEEYILPQDLPEVLKLAGGILDSMHGEEDGRFLLQLAQERAMAMPGLDLEGLAQSLPWDLAQIMTQAAVEKVKSTDPFAAVGMLRNAEVDTESWGTREAFKIAGKQDGERAFREAGNVRSLELRVDAYAGVLHALKDKEGLEAAWQKSAEITAPGLRMEAQKALLDSLSNDFRKRLEYAEFLLNAEDLSAAVKGYGMSQFLTNVSGSDITRNLEWITEHSDQLATVEVLPSLLSSLYRDLAYDKPEVAMERVLGESGAAREGGLRSVFGHLASSNASEAVAAASTLPEEDLAVVRPALVKGWAESQPAEAAAYVKQLGNVPGEADMVGNLIAKWATIDAVAASEWLIQLEQGPALDQGAMSLASWVSRSDPEAAAVWAMQVQDPKLRREALDKVADYWVKTPDKMKSWINANSVKLGEEDTALLLDKL